MSRPIFASMLSISVPCFLKAFSASFFLIIICIGFVVQAPEPSEAVETQPPHAVIPPANVAGDDLDIAALAAARRKERADSRANKATAPLRQSAAKQPLATAAMFPVHEQTRQVQQAQQTQQAQQAQQAQHAKGQWQPPMQQDTPLQAQALAPQQMKPGTGATATHPEQPPLAVLAPHAAADTAQPSNSNAATPHVLLPDSDDLSMHTVPSAGDNSSRSSAWQQQQQQRPLPSPDRVAEPRSDLSPQAPAPPLLPSVAENSAGKAAQPPHAAISNDSQAESASVKQLVGSAGSAAIADKQERGGDDGPAAQDAAARTIWQQLRTGLKLRSPGSATAADPPLRATEAEAKRTMRLPTWAPFSSGRTLRVTAAQRMQRRRLLRDFTSFKIATTAADVLPCENARLLPPHVPTPPERSPAALHDKAAASTHTQAALSDEATASTHTQIDEASQPQDDVNHQPQDDLNHQPQDGLTRQSQDDISRQPQNDMLRQHQDDVSRQPQDDTTYQPEDAATAAEVSNTVSNAVTNAPLESHSHEPHAAALPVLSQPAQMPPETLPAGTEETAATEAKQDTPAEQRGAAEQVAEGEADETALQSREDSSAVGAAAVFHERSNAHIDNEPSPSDTEIPPTQQGSRGRQQQPKSMTHSIPATEDPRSRMERRADSPWKDGARSLPSRVGPDRYASITRSTQRSAKASCDVLTCFWPSCIPGSCRLVHEEHFPVSARFQSWI